MKFVFTIQEKNFYDLNQGDCIDILGNTIVLLAAARLLNSFKNKHYLYLYVPDTLFKQFSSPSEYIIIINRDKMSFIDCLLDASSNHPEINDDVIWINTRFIGFEPKDFYNCIDYKRSKNLDLVFSSNDQTYLTRFNDELNIKKDINVNSPFFERNRLVGCSYFNRKFFIISPNKIKDIYDYSLLKIDFFSSVSGISIDKLLKVFPEHVIANLYLS